MSLQIGIDEAGRGPILGPMVLAAVALDEDARATLQAAGVADSKAFGSGPRAHQRRQELATAIESHASWVETRVASPAEIDTRVRHGELNQLERDMASEMLRRRSISSVDEIICDGHRLFQPMTLEFPGLIAKNKAELEHICVAAASIVAKHLRDQAFNAIAKRYVEAYGPLKGGGYPNAATHTFIEWHETTFGKPPEEIRHSWGRRNTT